ncbi:prepilin-type N-terminal cleavage/methylation domain-containing protein [Paenibacillus sp. yr247]|uniref:competence type IV pilus major pilin ComGC n=1 Tax=Paenibacillus sp. yr247 TaxID=1761880 RepID=UPI000887F4D3|nr:type II secretion system protein [Paenibacillus sp. yr247]SDN82955.1 prepilin-type N-terminal cleavage/methylation domain-containing protein [Paenibacillus sp. yr247]
MLKKMMNTRFKLLKNQKGLTLVELLAVIVILGVIAAIAVPAIGGVISNSKKNADTQTELLLHDAAVRYMTDVDPDGNGLLADGTTAVTGYASGAITVAQLVTAGYLKEAPKKQQLTTANTYTSIPVTFTNSSWTSTGTITVS